ncbi:MAG: insulinase family protein, partial [Bacteroidales bacterium]|nr:insulinase family protein [Bacteroidales bacterium]
ITTDLISDLLANGNSARLYQNLVKRRKIFSSIDAYITGDIDEGLLMVTGTVAPHNEMKQAEKELLDELKKLTQQRVEDEELQKVKNKVEAVRTYTKTSALHKAMNMAFYELLGDVNRINTEEEAYRKVTPDDIQRVGRQVLDQNNCSTLYYYAKKE